MKVEMRNDRVGNDGDEKQLTWHVVVVWISERRESYKKLYSDGELIAFVLKLKEKEKLKKISKSFPG